MNVVPCYICGYHPGLDICSAMHDAPNCATSSFQYKGPTVTMPAEVADAYEEVARLAEKRASLTCHGGDEWDILEALDKAVAKLRQAGFTTNVKDNNEEDHA